MSKWRWTLKEALEDLAVIHRQFHPAVEPDENISTLKPEGWTKDGMILTRSAELGTLDSKERMVSFSFSSDTPVIRGGHIEVLSHAPGALNTERLDAGQVPLLNNHDWNKPLGRVTQYRITDHRAYGWAKISRSPEGDQFLRDAEDGLMPGISVGYRIEDLSHRTNAAGEDEWTVNRWSVLEVSSTAVSLDTTTGLCLNAGE
jgi:HK97 family phage prohead protease